MNRDQIWQQLKDEEQTVYGKKMLDVFLTISTELNNKHLEEALDSGYEVNEEAIIKKISRNMISPELLEKIVNKEISSNLMRKILENTESRNMKEIAKKLQGNKNLNKMTIDDIYTLTWVKINNIKEIQEIFGEKLKQFDGRRIVYLINESLYSATSSTGIALLEKVVGILGGWKSIAEKMSEEDTQQIPDYYLQLKINLDRSGLDQHFAEKIIEHDKNAIALAQFFYPDAK